MNVVKFIVQGIFYESFRKFFYLGLGEGMIQAESFFYTSSSSAAIAFRQKSNFFVIGFIAVSKLSEVAVWQTGSEVFA